MTPADLDRLAGWQSTPVRQAWGPREGALYALGVGLGMNPADEASLRFAAPEPEAVLPTMACVLGYPGFWLRDQGFVAADGPTVVHAEQALVLAEPLPVSGCIEAVTRVSGLARRRPGLFVTSERQLVDRASGRTLARLVQSSVLLGVAAGPEPKPAPAAEPMPTRAADAVAVLPTSPQGAMIYSLSGDANPLHSDPAVARAAGYPRPILHGLATFGLVGWAVARTLAGGEAERLGALSGRFSAPVFPGERLRVEMWVEGEQVRLRARVDARGVVVFDRGSARLTG